MLANNRWDSQFYSYYTFFAYYTPQCPLTYNSHVTLSFHIWNHVSFSSTLSMFTSLTLHTCVTQSYCHNFTSHSPHGLTCRNTHLLLYLDLKTNRLFMTIKNQYFHFILIA